MRLQKRNDRRNKTKNYNDNYDSYMSIEIEIKIERIQYKQTVTGHLSILALELVNLVAYSKTVFSDKSSEMRRFEPQTQNIF